MIRTIIAKTLAVLFGLMGLIEIWMGLHLALGAITNPDSFATLMVPMFLIPGFGQVAAGAFVLWQYSAGSVRSLSVVFGLWVWFLVALAIEQTGVWATSPPDITWQNVAVVAPIVAGVLAYQLCCRFLSPDQHADPAGPDKTPGSTSCHPA